MLCTALAACPNLETLTLRNCSIGNNCETVQWADALPQLPQHLPSLTALLLQADVGGAATRESSGAAADAADAGRRTAPVNLGAVRARPGTQPAAPGAAIAGAARCGDHGHAPAAAWAALR